MVPCFVFGSNLAGRHGKGAALWALKNRGAKYGIGEGYCGNSYAIPTKDAKIQTLHLDEIARHVAWFKDFARANPDMQFELTPIGCGLAGYRHDQIAPMFADAPENVMIPREFKEVLDAKARRNHQ